MKKIFALVAVALATLSANALTPAATYTLDNQKASYVLGANGKDTTYTMDGVDGWSVNYIGASSAKMQIYLAANYNIWFEYSNSKAKTNVVKTGATYFQCDSKNFVINCTLETGDVVYVKYSAKGSTSAIMSVYGEEPCIEEDDTSENTSTSKDEVVVFSATATKGGTAKIKETNGGMRVYSISINQAPATGIAELKAGKETGKVYENGHVVIYKNGVRYNVLGAKL